MSEFLEITDLQDARYANAVLVALDLLCRSQEETCVNELGEDYLRCRRCGETDFLDVRHSDSCLFSVLNDKAEESNARQGRFIAACESGAAVVFDENAKPRK